MGRGSDELGKPAVGAQPEREVAGAQVRPTPKAPGTLSTRDTRTARDPVPEAQRHLVAGRYDRTDEFVAEDRRARMSTAGMANVKRHHHGAFGILGGVGAAEPVVGDLDDHLVRRAAGFRSVLHPEVAETVQHCRFHDELP